MPLTLLHLKILYSSKIQSKDSNQRIITHVADLKSALNVVTPDYVAVYPPANGLITTPTVPETLFMWERGPRPNGPFPI